MSSADALDVLAEKFFSSLIEPSGQIYGSGGLGSIPDMFPMLLVALRESLINLDPYGRIPEIEPGLSVTLDPLGKNQLGPSAFVSFSSQLENGSFLVGSFSPIKFLNWATSRELVRHISTEIDELLDDLERNLDPLDWRDNKYEIITTIINERAELITKALNSRALRASSSWEDLRYSVESAALLPLSIDYEKIPFEPTIPEEQALFWRKQTGELKDFVNIVRGVHSVSVEPLKALNRDSLTQEVRQTYKDYVPQLAKHGETLYVGAVEPVVQTMGRDLPEDDQVEDLTRRYLGMKAIKVVIEYYVGLLGGYGARQEILDEFKKFLTDSWVRRFSLGYVTTKPFAGEFLEHVVPLFREFRTTYSTTDKETLNHAIIQISQSKGEDLVKELEKLQFKPDPEGFEKYLLFWAQAYPGLMPEEITLMLTTGIVYMVFDYRRMACFGTFVVEDNESKLDMGMMRDLGRKSIESGKISPKLIGET